MGRIEEALRRAAEHEDGGDQPTVPAVLPPSPSDEAFVSPWSFTVTQVSTPNPTETPPTPSSDGATPSSGGTLKSEPMALFRGFKRDIEERLVVGKGSPPLLAEQFRRLAATLHHAQLIQKLKVIMITSANASEGKSLTAANLALTLSESYRREVLLIDADLRRPSLHDVFQVPNVAGLNDGLKSDTEGQLCAVKITPTLTLLPAGRPDPDPMSGLTSTRMRHILEEASARFDWVILDTPPIGLLADAGIVGTMVDGALMVIRAGQTAHPTVLKAVEAFGRERILGVVLNDTDTRPDDEAGARYYAHPVEPPKG
ncbi:MAG: CpsD/CapB family tyrosine-protein kinase [Vicinamibacteraceae bacterium]